MSHDLDNTLMDPGIKLIVVALKRKATRRNWLQDGLHKSAITVLSDLCAIKQIKVTLVPLFLTSILFQPLWTDIINTW